MASEIGSCIAGHSSALSTSIYKSIYKSMHCHQRHPAEPTEKQLYTCKHVYCASALQRYRVGTGEDAAAAAEQVEHSLGQIPAWAPNKEQVQDILQVNLQAQHHLCCAGRHDHAFLAGEACRRSCTCLLHPAIFAV